MRAMAVLTISVERAPGKLSLTFADGVNRALIEQTLAVERRCCAAAPSSSWVCCIVPSLGVLKPRQPSGFR